jgi:hypothetical protein
VAAWLRCHRRTHRRAELGMMRNSTLLHLNLDFLGLDEPSPPEARVEQAADVSAESETWI